jgi:uncharacterized protein (TIGR02270 family)
LGEVIEDIVAEQVEEVSFLWLLRDRAVGDHRYSLETLADLDERVEAHLDGLRAAGPPAWDVCEDTLEWVHPGEAFVGATVALENADGSGWDFILEMVRKAPLLARGVVSALGWLSPDCAASRIRNLLDAGCPVARRIGIAASAVHRLDPGPALEQALRDDDPLLRARALQAAGELGRVDLLPVIRHGINARDEACRLAACRAGVLLGDKAAVEALMEFATSPFGAEAVDIVCRALKGGPAREWLMRLGGEPALVRLAVQGAAATGDPSVVAWLIERMFVPALARAAGRSFTLITGIPLPSEGLEGKAPEDLPPPDVDVEEFPVDPDEEFPWPDPLQVRAWWQRNGGAFAEGRRYLLGSPVDRDNLRRILREGRQTERAAAALELTLMKPGLPLFEVRAQGVRQQHLLGSL